MAQPRLPTFITSNLRLCTLTPTDSTLRLSILFFIFLPCLRLLCLRDIFYNFVSSVVIFSLGLVALLFLCLRKLVFRVSWAPKRPKFVHNNSSTCVFQFAFVSHIRHSFQEWSSDKGFVIRSSLRSPSKKNIRYGSFPSAQKKT